MANNSIAMKKSINPTHYSNKAYTTPSTFLKKSGKRIQPLLPQTYIICQSPLNHNIGTFESLTGTSQYYKDFQKQIGKSFDNSLPADIKAGLNTEETEMLYVFDHAINFANSKIQTEEQYKQEMVQSITKMYVKKFGGKYTTEQISKSAGLLYEKKVKDKYINSLIGVYCTNKLTYLIELSKRNDIVRLYYEDTIMSGINLILGMLNPKETSSLPSKLSEVSEEHITAINRVDMTNSARKVYEAVLNYIGLKAVEITSTYMHKLMDITLKTKLAELTSVENKLLSVIRDGLNTRGISSAKFTKILSNTEKILFMQKFVSNKFKTNYADLKVSYYYRIKNYEKTLTLINLLLNHDAEIISTEDQFLVGCNKTFLPDKSIEQLTFIHALCLLQLNDTSKLNQLIETTGVNAKTFYTQMALYQLEEYIFSNDQQNSLSLAMSLCNNEHYQITLYNFNSKFSGKTDLSLVSGSTERVKNILVKVINDTGNNENKVLLDFMNSTFNSKDAK